MGNNIGTIGGLWEKWVDHSGTIARTLVEQWTNDEESMRGNSGTMGTMEENGGTMVR